MPRIKPVDHAGKRFGRLIALNLIPRKTRWGNRIWECKCDCGTIKEISSSQLVAGYSRSCGCLQRDIQRKRFLKSPGEGSFNLIFKTYRNNADGRSFTISEQQFRDMIARPCHYCGRPPFNIYKSLYGTGDLIYNGIDRVDSSRGYEPDNCVPCCKFCNRAKMAMSISDFKAWVNLVYAHWASK